MTIGWYGKERVDYMTYDTKGIWRCYEIKISKSDFHSKNHNTFIGNYNYYVLTDELYEQVKDEIPKGIGAYIGSNLVKRAKKQELKVNKQILTDSMIRSLSRYLQKQMDSNNDYLIDRYKRELNRSKKDLSNYRDKYYQLGNWIREKHSREILKQILKGE